MNNIEIMRAKNELNPIGNVRAMENVNLIEFLRAIRFMNHKE